MNTIGSHGIYKCPLLLMSNRDVVHTVTEEAWSEVEACSEHNKLFIFISQQFVCFDVFVFTDFAL